MTTFVALLRNAIFDAPRSTPAKHASAIAAAIAGRLAIDVPVVVKSARELAAIVSGNPLARRAEDHARLLVAFTQEARSLRDLAAIGALVVPPERFVLGRHAAYLLCAGGILQSKAGEALLGKAGKAATTRNWATTLRLHGRATTARI